MRISKGTTFEQLVDLFKDFTKDDSSANETRGEGLINDKMDEVLGLHDWYFMEKTKDITSVANQQEYNLPVDYDRLLEVWTKVDDVYYTPEYIGNLDKWWKINSRGTNTTSDITEGYTIIGDKIYLYPTPSSTDVTLTILYRQTAPNMSADDYETGTITTASGDNTVTGSGTTFTATMEGRYIEIAGIWYKIDDFTDDTHIEIEDEPLDVVSGVSYIIGELPPIPGEFHDMLWKGATAEYYALKGEPEEATYWEQKFMMRKNALMKRYKTKTKSNIIRRSNGQYVNPNSYPQDLTD